MKHRSLRGCLLYNVRQASSRSNPAIDSYHIRAGTLFWGVVSRCPWCRIMIETRVAAASPRLLLDDFRPELLKGVYFRELADTVDLTFERPLIDGRKLMIPVRVCRPEVDDRKWPGSGPCPLGRHRWEYHDVTTATVHDVPIGGHQTHLRVTRTVYSCAARDCKARVTPWPPGLLAESMPRRNVQPARITQRLFEFVLEQWSEGFTVKELQELTGLSRELVTRIIDAAPSFLAALPGDDRVPLVIGIDEIYLHKRYYTVISDLSMPEGTPLIDLAWGRVGFIDERLRKSKSADERPPKGAVRLADVVRDLAERSLAESKRKGYEWRFPIVSSDGWTAFRSTIQNGINKVAARNGVGSPPELTYFPDIWHLKRGLVLEDRKAKAILDRGAQRLQEDLEHRMKRLRYLNQLMITGSKRKAAKARKAYWRKVPEFNQYLKELGFPLNCRWENDHLQRSLEPEEKSRVTGLRTIHASRVLDGIKQLHGTGLKLIEAVRVCGRDMLLADEDEHSLRKKWRDALYEFDKHPLTRIPDGGYPYGRFDRDWQPSEDSAERSAISRMLRTAASRRLVSFQEDIAMRLPPALPVTAEIAKVTAELEAQQWLISSEDHPQLYATILKLNEHTRELLTGNGSSPGSTANDVFLLKRPTNSKTERLNRKIRAVLLKSQNLSAESYTRLRSRLLLRFSGRFIPKGEEHTSIPVVEMPAECSGCGSDNVITSDGHYEQNHLGLPAGWKPMRYVVRSPRWTCRTCGSKSPTTKAGRNWAQTGSLEAYLQHVSEQPRLGSLPITLWRARTGVPKRQLARLLTGPVPEKDEPAEGPARIIGLAVTSKAKRRNTAGSYRDFELLDQLEQDKEDDEPRIVMVNLRHGTRPDPHQPDRYEGKGAPLKSPRLLAHERMSVKKLVRLLAEAHAQAGAELKVLLTRRMHRFADELQAASAGRWTLVTDPHNALPAVTRVAWNTYNHWKYGTYTKMQKERRRDHNPNPISPKRDTHEETMEKYLVTELFEKLDDAEAAELKRLARWNHKMVTDQDYHQEDIPIIRAHLHTWKHLLVNFTPDAQAEFADNVGRLLEAPPELESKKLTATLEEFHAEMRLIVPMLHNSIPGAASDPIPNTHNGVYNTAQLGGVRNQLLQLDSARGFQPT